MNPPRAYVAADEATYEDLLRRGGGAPQSRARLKWKYAPEASSRWVIDEGPRLVGHTGFVALPLQLAGRDALAGTSGDAFTDPAWRGKGVYSALSRHVDAAVGPRAALQFAWFHDGWSGFQRDLGWLHLGRLEWRRALVAPLRAGLEHLGLRGRRMAGRADRWIWRAPATDRRLTARPATTAALDTAWGHVAGRWPLSLRRDAAWFAWRASEPTRPSEVCVAWRGDRPVGTVAFRSEAGRFGARGLLLDASFAPDEPEVATFLVAHATATLAASGVTHVAALAVPSSAWDQALAANGLRPRGVGYDLGVLPYTRLPDAPPSAWALTGAEGDST